MGLSRAEYRALLDMRCAAVDEADRIREVAAKYERAILDHVADGSLTADEAAGHLRRMSRDLATQRLYVVNDMRDAMRRLEHRLPAGQEVLAA